MTNDITRRDFCKTTAAGMAGILASGIAPSLYAAGANEKIRVACVGYSDRFRASLLPAFRRHEQELKFDLVAVADLWKKRLYENAKPELEKAYGHEIEAFGSDMALYDAKDKLGLDAVIISTADFQHAQHAVHAANAGLDAYCEKPIAEDMYSANLLLDTINAKRQAGYAPGAILQIGTQRRSGPAYAAAKEFINSGKFGDICYVNLTWNVNQPKRWRRPEKLIASLKETDIDWKMWLLDRDPDTYKFDPRQYLEFRLFWPFSSGVTGQWMCHQIDTIAWFTGYKYPKSAVSSGGLYQWVDGRQSFDTFTTLMEYGESGVKGKGFQVMFQSHQTNCLPGGKLNAENGQEQYFSTSGMIDLVKGTVSNGGVEGAKYKEENLPAPKTEIVTSANTGGDPLTTMHMRNWMECVRSRKDPNASVDAGYSHAVALIMSNAAARTGMRAMFDEEKRQVMCGGKPFVGYESTAQGWFDRLFS